MIPEKCPRCGAEFPDLDMDYQDSDYDNEGDLVEFYTAYCKCGWEGCVYRSLRCVRVRMTDKDDDVLYDSGYVLEG